MPPTRRSRDRLLAAGAAASAAAYTWYYLKSCRVPDLILDADSDVGRAVLDGVPLLTQPYRPTPWAVNGHVQTIVNRLRAWAVDARYTRQLLSSPADGGCLAVDWAAGSDSPASAAPDAPVLLVLHGTAGSSDEGHCKHACAAAAEAGWRAAVLNARGVGGVPLTAAAGVGAAATTADVALALASVADRFPRAPLVAVGYSAGGLTLAKYLAEADSGAAAAAGVRAPRLAAAVVVSSPFCAGAVVGRLAAGGPAAALYTAHLTAALRRFAAEHASALAAAGVDVAALRTATRLEPFVAAAAALASPPAPATPTAGGGGGGIDVAATYLADAATAAHVPSIRTPTLFLASADDPLAGAPPRAAFAANPHTVLATTARGGHLGFLTGATGLGRSWAEGAALQFLAVFAVRRGGDWRVVPRAARVGAEAAASPPRSRSTSPSPADAVAAVAVQAAAAAVSAAGGAWRAVTGGGRGTPPPRSPSPPARRAGKAAAAAAARAAAADGVAPPPPCPAPALPPRPRRRLSRSVSASRLGGGGGGVGVVASPARSGGLRRAESAARLPGLHLPGGVRPASPLAAVAGWC